MKSTYCILTGKENADIASKFQGNYCYRRIIHHGKRIAQVEVLDGENGVVMIWVYDYRHFDKVVKQLRRMGFLGYLEIEEEETGDTIAAIDLFSYNYFK